MPLFRRSGYAAGTFKPPRLSDGADVMTGAATPRPSSSAATSPATVSKREVVYPPPSGKTAAQIRDDKLANRRHIDYHQPEPKTAKKLRCEGNQVTLEEKNNSKKLATVGGEVAVAGAASTEEEEAERLLLAALEGVGPEHNGGEGAKAEEEEEDDEEEDKPDVISRYPVSPHGKLYFQVETDGATKHETTSIIIVDVRMCGIQMFDRVGRHYGNRPDPGYLVKESEVAGLRAGATIRVGQKSCTVVTALREEVFRSGEFFLQSEHWQRKIDQKRQERAAAVAEATSRKPKMTFGRSMGMFAAFQHRKRPREGQTGFIVPLKGRVKVGGPGQPQELHPLHDPDRKDAVVLFRAEYRRDANNRRIVSVVVDPIIGDKLRPHQRVGVQFLYDSITGEKMPGYYGAILADEMGLGKTIQTVATVYTCLRQGKHGTPICRKCLVVAPSSLVKNWCNEFEKWLGPGAIKAEAISESTPKGDRIISRFESEGDVLVISYDQLRKYNDRLCGIKAIELVVCDEGHKLKNAEIKTTKAVDKLPSKRRIILSGTPIQNDLAEFHAMVGFVNPGMLGNGDLFKRVFEEPIMRGRDPDCEEEERELGADRSRYLAHITQKFILRRMQTINEKYLPPKVDVTVFCRLGAEQRATYEKISQLAPTLASKPLVLITALKKLCNHMDLLYDAIASEGSQISLPRSVLPKGFQPGKLGASLGSKLEFVSTMLDEITGNGDNDKLVIVSNYTQTLDIIANLCTKKRVSFFQLDGKTPIKRRQELVDRFNAQASREVVFLLSSKAGGVGLNLIGANRLILFDPDWNPANDAQAMGRVWRDGQKKKVFIYRLLSTGTIEEKVYQRQVSKQGLSANVVDMKDDSKQHFTLEELKALFAFRPDTACDTHDLLGCHCCSKQAAAMSVTNMKYRKVGEPRSGPWVGELKGWMHVSDATRFSLDKVLVSIAKSQPQLVSFLFANERDAKKVEAEVVTEKGFAGADGAEITCSQLDGGDEEIEFDVVHDSDTEDEEAEAPGSSDDDDDDE